MDYAAIIGIVLQTIVLLIAIIGAFVKSKQRDVRTDAALKAVNTRCEHIERNTNDLKSDHEKLSDKVDGISRHVATIEGQLGARRNTG